MKDTTATDVLAEFGGGRLVHVTRTGAVSGYARHELTFAPPAPLYKGEVSGWTLEHMTCPSDTCHLYELSGLGARPVDDVNERLRPLGLLGANPVVNGKRLGWAMNLEMWNNHAPRMQLGAALRPGEIVVVQFQPRLGDTVTFPRFATFVATFGRSF